MNIRMRGEIRVEIYEQWYKVHMVKEQRITTTNLTFRGGCLLPQKVTFVSGFGFGGGLYKTATNRIDTKSFDF